MSTTAIQTGTAPPDERLPVGRVRHSAGRFDDAEFQTFPDVPVFAEHVTKRKDGETMEFGKPELEAIARRCNRRIQETGDYAVLTLGHTPDPDDANGKDPEVVGYAGPYRVGLVGSPGGAHRYAILADFHVFKEKAGEVKKHPRRSPELWLADSPEDMFLDPIALLGASPPRLDMGMLYSAKFQGRECLKYTAVAPSAGSVFVPKEKEYKDYSKQIIQGEKHMFDADEVQQMLDAFEQLDWVQFAKAQMMAAQGTNATPGLEAELPMEEAMPAEPLGEIPGGLPGEDPNGLPPQGPAAGMDTEPLGEAPPEEMPPVGDEELQTPEGLGPPQGEMPQEEEEIMPEAGIAPPEEKTENFPGEEASPEDAKKKLKDAMDAMEDDELEDYVRGRKIGKYAVTGTADDETSGTPPSTGSAEVQTETLGTGTAETQKQYSKKQEDGIMAAKLGQKGHTLQDMQGRLDQVTRELDVERGKRVDAERYALLSERRQRLAFDLDQAEEQCKYGKMSDEQFKYKLDDMDANYRKIPIGEQLPTHGAGIDATTRRATMPEQKTEKYAKQDTDKAVRLCTDAASRGEKLSYECALDMARESRNGETVKA